MRPVWVHLKNFTPPVAINANNIVRVQERFDKELNKPVLTLFDVAGQDYVVRGMPLQRWLTMARRAARP